ncbi:pyridoxine kinase [Pseudoscourfieldia marina]
MRYCKLFVTCTSSFVISSSSVSYLFTRKGPIRRPARFGGDSCGLGPASAARGIYTPALVSRRRTCNSCSNSCENIRVRTGGRRTQPAGMQGSDEDSQRDATTTYEGVPPRVLTVQSHVVAGRVGNRCAELPLNLLGCEADALHTVHFSNHLGFPSHAGRRCADNEVSDLLTGLRSNGLLAGRYRALLTGYIGTRASLEAVVSCAREMRNNKSRGDFDWYLDPVLGDHGRVYVPDDVAECMRREAVPLASVVTPNGFEASVLAGMAMPPSNEGEAFACADAIHAMGPHTVVITSLPNNGGGHAQGSNGESAGYVCLYGSTTMPQDDGLPQRFCIRSPIREGYYTGTGDLFAALLCGHTLQMGYGRVSQACERAAATLQEVLRVTEAVSTNLRNNEPKRDGDAEKAAEARRRELQLVRCRAAIVDPPPPLAGGVQACAGHPTPKVTLH